MRVLLSEKFKQYTILNMNKLTKIFGLPYVLWWLPVIVITVFFYPVLFGGKLIFGVAHGISEDLPIHFWFGEAIKSGSWGINHLYFGGVPSYLSQMDLLHPIPFLFYKLLKPISAYYWLIALSVMGQWYCFYLLSRKLKISSLSAIFASFVWIFSQWNIQLGGLEAIGLFLVSVPLLFFLVIKISEGRHRFWYALLTAAALAPNWVFSLTQTTLYLATFLILFSLFLDYQTKKFDFLKYGNTLICAGVILLSVAIVFPIIKADYAIYSLGFRSGGLSYQETFKDYFNVFDFVHFVSPFLILPFINTEYTHFYISILPLLLIFLTWKIWNKDPHIRFFQWMAFLTIITAVEYSPIFYILSKFPIFNLFRGSGKFIFLSTFSMAVLAGFGLDTLKEGHGFNLFVQIARVYKKALIVLGSVVVAINLLNYFAFETLASIGFKVFMRFGYSHTLQREPFYYTDKVKDLLDSWFYQFSFSNVEVWLVIITLVSTGLIIAGLIKGKISVNSFSVLAILITVSSSFFIWHRYYAFVSVSILQPVPAVQFLMEHEDSRYRTLSFNLGIESYKKLGLEHKNPEKYFKFETSNLISDVSMFYGIETLNGHEAFLTQRQNFFADFTGQFATQTIGLDEKKKIFESKIDLLSVMNVKYIISSLPLGQPFIKRFESVITDTSIPLYIYENPRALPKVYFAKSAKYLEENLSDDILRNKLAEVSDFRREILVECDSCKENLLNSGGTINFESYKPDETVLNVENKKNSWLVFSNSYLPGWKAWIDGGEVRIYRANYFWQTIQVPAGEHEVVFRYKIL